MANYLRDEINHGTWTDKMPGGATLARKLAVGRMTADAALELMEKKGLLISQGPGRGRLINSSEIKSSSMKVAILPLMSSDHRFDYIMELQNLLQFDGHTVVFPDKSISDLGGEVPRVAQLVEKTSADAWIIIAGPKDVLSWFAESSIPTFAMFGRRRGLNIASIGPDKSKAYRSMVRRLVQLSHRRISLITRPIRRLPIPGLPERAFLDELQLSGIQTSSYHLPDWDGKTETLGPALDSIFAFTPPTALIVDEPPLFFAVQHHLAQLGIIAPNQISLACTDWDPYFEMLDPSIAHIQWDSHPWVKRVSRWVNNVSKGKIDHKQTLTKAPFIEAGSIGPAP